MPPPSLTRNDTQPPPTLMRSNPPLQGSENLNRQKPPRKNLWQRPRNWPQIIPRPHKPIQFMAQYPRRRIIKPQPPLNRLRQFNRMWIIRPRMRNRGDIHQHLTVFILSHHHNRARARLPPFLRARPILAPPKITIRNNQTRRGNRKRHLHATDRRCSDAPPVSPRPRSAPSRHPSNPPRPPPPAALVS